MSIFDPKVTQSVSQSQTVPWGAQMPYLDYLFKQAKSIYDQGGPAYYPESTVAAFSPQQEQALGLIENRALSGGPLQKTGQDYMKSVLQGDYLQSNPWLDKVYDRGASAITRNFNEAVTPGIDSAAINAGRYGSGAWENLRDSANDRLGRTLSGYATELYGGDYSNERKRMQEMIPYLPAYDAMDYSNYDKLLGVGNVVQGQGQRVLDSNVDRFNYNENLPYSNLGQYSGLINGTYGETTTKTTPEYSNSDFQNLLGAGAGIYSFFDKIPELKQYAPWMGGGMALGSLFL